MAEPVDPRQQMLLLAQRLVDSKVMSNDDAMKLVGVRQGKSLEQLFSDLAPNFAPAKRAGLAGWQQSVLQGIEDGQDMFDIETDIQDGVAAGGIFPANKTTEEIISWAKSQASDWRSFSASGGTDQNKIMTKYGLSGDPQAQYSDESVWQKFPSLAQSMVDFSAKFPSSGESYKKGGALDPFKQTSSGGKGRAAVATLQTQLDDADAAYKDAVALLPSSTGDPKKLESVLANMANLKKESDRLGKEYKKHKSGVKKFDVGTRGNQRNIDAAMKIFLNSPRNKDNLEKLQKAQQDLVDHQAEYSDYGPATVSTNRQVGQSASSYMAPIWNDPKAQRTYDSAMLQMRKSLDASGQTPFNDSLFGLVQQFGK